MLDKSGQSFFEKEREELEKIEQKHATRVLKWYDFGTSKLREEIKRRPAQYFFLFITSFLGSVITSAVALFGFSSNILALIAVKNIPTPTPAAQVASAQKVVETEKYDHLLLAQNLKAKKDEVVIIDIRGVKEYNDGHIVTAVNLPIYGSVMVNSEGNLDSEAILSRFKEKVTSDKLIVIYGPNSYASLPSDVAAILNNSGKKAKPLAVGWEEWYELQK